MLSQHFDKNNLHHAYLIEGAREEIVPEIQKFMKEIQIETLKNPDFCQIILDSLKIEDARNIRSLSEEKSTSKNKKIFIISANNFLLEAQNTLLKMFEEPIENTHFFLIIPDANILLPTLVSRFYFISNLKEGQKTEDAEKFIAMPVSKRLDFIKELLIEGEDEEALVLIDSVRAKALRFLNSLELVLHKKVMSKISRGVDVSFFSQIFKVREFLRQPGSSAKSLMESLALTIPNL
ncbi:MAG: hypothetical protein Q8O46_00055 [bacterium]|nr:hypothetical protein [bacterium]